MSNYQDLSNTEFEKQWQASDNAILLDVRTPEEFAEGKIEGAININVLDGSFAAELQGLDSAKDYYVYCRSGGRSGQACSIMASKGFKTLSNLQGGVLGWHAELV